jgi:hypothetical protein
MPRDGRSTVGEIDFEPQDLLPEFLCSNRFA